MELGEQTFKDVDFWHKSSTSNVRSSPVTYLEC